MEHLHWTYVESGSYYFLLAQAENGMSAVILGKDEDFAFPGAWVEYSGLRKLPDPDVIFVDKEGAMRWCESEMSKWEPKPKAKK